MIESKHVIINHLNRWVESYDMDNYLNDFEENVEELLP